MSRYRPEPSHDHAEPARVGVLLVQLGTPDAATPAALRRYLAEFLTDLGRQLAEQIQMSVLGRAGPEEDRLLIGGLVLVQGVEDRAGIVGLAVPIRDSGGRAVAALAMHGPVTRLSLKACEARVPRLVQAAERIASVWIAE